MQIIQFSNTKSMILYHKSLERYITFIILCQNKWHANAHVVTKRNERGSRIVFYTGRERDVYTLQFIV